MNCFSARRHNYDSFIHSLYLHVSFVFLSLWLPRIVLVFIYSYVLSSLTSIGNIIYFALKPFEVKDQMNKYETMTDSIGEHRADSTNKQRKDHWQLIALWSSPDSLYHYYWFIWYCICIAHRMIFSFFVLRCFFSYSCDNIRDSSW